MTNEKGIAVTQVHGGSSPQAGTSAQKGTLAIISPELLEQVKVRLVARLGEGRMTAAQLIGLKTADIVPLESSLADFVELYLEDALVARGEIVAIDDKYGVRITELATTK